MDPEACFESQVGHHHFILNELPSSTDIDRCAYTVRELRKMTVPWEGKVLPSER